RIRPRSRVRTSVAEHTVPKSSHRLCAQRSVPAGSRPRRWSALVRGDRRPGRTDGHRPSRVGPHRDRPEAPSPGAVHSDRHGLLPRPDPRRDLGESQGAAGYHQVTDQRRNEEAARRVGGEPMSTDRDYLAAGLALGGLSEDELTEARALSDSDPDFRAEVAAYDEVMAEAAGSDEPAEISAEARAAILRIPETHEQETEAEASTETTSSTAPEPLAEPTPVADRRGRRAGRRSWLPYVAAAAALIVIAGFGVTIWQQN